MTLSNITITQADFRAYQRWFQQYDRFSRWSLRVLKILLVVLFGLGLLIGLLGDWPQGGAFMALSLFFAAFFFGLVRFRTALAFKAKKNAPLYAPRTMVIDDTGITTTMATNTGHADWSAYQYVAETPEIFILMVAQKMGQLIPKSGLTDAQVSELRQIIQANAPVAVLMRN